MNVWGYKGEKNGLYQHTVGKRGQTKSQNLGGMKKGVSITKRGDSTVKQMSNSSPRETALTKKRTKKKTPQSGGPKKKRKKNWEGTASSSPERKGELERKAGGFQKKLEIRRESKAGEYLTNLTGRERYKRRKNTKETRQEQKKKGKARSLRKVCKGSGPFPASKNLEWGENVSTLANFWW